MPELAHKKTADLDGRRYSPGDRLYCRFGPVHTCVYVRVCWLVIGTSSQVPWNWRGRRLVELTKGNSSGVDSQGLPSGFEYLPHPWGTHYQFSIKTLLSERQRIKKRRVLLFVWQCHKVSKCTRLALCVLAIPVSDSLMAALPLCDTPWHSVLTNISSRA